MAGGAPAAFPDDADRVGVVDKDPGIMLFGYPNKIWEIDNFTARAEDPVGYDQLPNMERKAGDDTFHVSHIIMFIPHNLGKHPLCHHITGDDASVVILIGDKVF